MLQKHFLRRIAFLALCLGLAATAATADTSTADYVLQPGDVLGVSVIDEESLNREVLVRPDGGMSFPMIGDIRVAGLSPNAARDEIERLLDAFVPGASVTVSVVQISGNQVFVLGKVNRAGAYPIYRPLDVMQALALAGGTAQFAGLDDIVILRRDAAGRQQILPFRYSQVVSGRALEQNILLQAGDTIVVP